MRGLIIAAAILPLALSGCVAQPPPNRAAARGVSCLPLDRVVSRRPEGPRHLRFEMSDGTIYRNELAAACPPLQHREGAFDVISLELQGNRVCSGDSFRVIDPAEARAVGIGAFSECRLGRFILVSG